MKNCRRTNTKELKVEYNFAASLDILRGPILGKATIIGYFTRWVDSPRGRVNRRLPNEAGFGPEGLTGCQVADMWQNMADAVLHIEELR